MDSTKMLGQLPHALSLARALLVGATHVAVFRGDVPLFAALVLLTVLTDVLDGPLARAYHTASRFGANVDTAADMLFYLSLPVWVWRFRPEVVTEHFPEILGFVVMYLIANLASQRVFGALGVHNRLSRASGTGGVVFAFVAILWGYQAWAYYSLMVLLAIDLGQRYSALLSARKRGPATGNP